GAPEDEFYERCNELLYSSVQTIIDTCPASGWLWICRKNTRLVLLQGLAARASKDLDYDIRELEESVLHVLPPGSEKGFSVAPLMVAKCECQNFYFANGSVSNGAIEFIDYSTGRLLTEQLGERFADILESATPS